VQINGTVAYNVTVSAVIDVNVTATNTWKFSNGTELNSLVTLDTDSGTLFFSVYDWAFLGFYNANLGVNDVLYPGGNLTDPIRINQTTTREYASGKRDTNVVIISYDSSLASDPTNSTVGTTTITHYIDKATGVLVERKIFTEFPDQNGTELWKLKSTNLWAVSAAPLDPLMIVVAVVAAVVVAAVVGVVYRGRRRRGRRSRH
jgi:hypothetical protein